MLIRDTVPDDLPAILTVHNAAIAETTAIWDEEQVELADRQAWFDQRTGAGLPILTADIDGQMAGYASYGPFRPKTGYRHTVENSVYVAHVAATSPHRTQRQKVKVRWIQEIRHANWPERYP